MTLVITAGNFFYVYAMSCVNFDCLVVTETWQQLRVTTCLCCVSTLIVWLLQRLDNSSGWQLVHVVCQLWLFGCYRDLTTAQGDNLFMSCVNFDCLVVTETWQQLRVTTCSCRVSTLIVWLLQRLDNSSGWQLVHVVRQWASVGNQRGGWCQEHRCLRYHSLRWRLGRLWLHSICQFLLFILFITFFNISLGIGMCLLKSQTCKQKNFYLTMCTKNLPLCSILPKSNTTNTDN